MPELFPNPTVYVLSLLIVAGAQLIYATVGFGAGMFSIALLALLLPDLPGTVTTLFLITLVTEVWVLCHAWRQARLRMLLTVLPTAILGLWLGTHLLVTGEVGWLKRLLGVVVLAAGAWFLYEERRNRSEATASTSLDVGGGGRLRAWASLPVGLASGVLAALFGTGGPPVIILLRGYRLDKGAFRATLLWFFLLMSVLRAGGYAQAGLLTMREVVAAGWLLPGSLIGVVVGMAAHRHLSERHFARGVSVLLILLGGLLMFGGGR
ncbi:MAG: sulfite exporter TauE/SafE family protein [bacterium]|nr:sulfite exporter TauE/SafE family protein [bacterium]